MWNPNEQSPATVSRFELPKLKLTTRFIESATVTERVDYQDTVVAGLSLRIAPSGVKTWNLIYTRADDRAKQRLKIGRFPAVTLEAARKRALQLMGDIASGEDPADEKRKARASATVQELGEAFIAKYAKPNKRSWAEDERLLKAEVYSRIGKRKVSAVTRRDVLDIVEGKFLAGFPAQSNNILAVVRKMFNWAVDTDYLAASPAHGIKPRGKIVRRDRVLTTEEVRAIWQKLDEAPIHPATANIIRMLFLTGQRSGEACGMCRAEIDHNQALWVLPQERTKNGLAHVVPLSDAALALITPALRSDQESDTPLFTRTGEPIESNAIAQAVRKKLQVSTSRWTPHDIRRTVATGMAGLGVAPHVIEAVLNHISGAKAGVAGIYNRATYEPEKRAALLLWAGHLARITA